MTQWKLVPVEPTAEMVEQGAHYAFARWMPNDSVQDSYNIARAQWKAMLSATPSPAPAEGDVEAVARAIYETYPPMDEHGLPIPWESDMASRQELCRDEAHAAISALRNRQAMNALLRMDGELYDVVERPTLSPEDRARAKEVAQEIRGYAGHDAPWLAKRADELLSLIDELTEAG